MSLDIRGAREEDRDRLLDFLPTVLIAEREYVIAEARNQPGALWEHSRMGLVGGDIVCHIRLYPRPIRLAGQVVQTGNIGGVCTDPDHRRKGYASQLLRDALAYFNRNGIPMSIIHSGVTGFYTSEGWETFPQHRYSYRTRAPFARQEGIEVRRCERYRDLDAVARVHEAYNRDRSLAVVRDSDYWQKHFSWIREREEGFLVAEQHDAIIGYVRSSESAVHEIAFLPEQPQAAEALLESVTRQAAKRGVEQVRMDVPADFPLLNALRECGVLTETVGWGMLVRTASLRRLLENVAGGLQVPDEDGAVTICVGDQSATISFDQQAAAIVEQPAERTVTLSQRDLFLWLSGAPPEGASDGALTAWPLLRRIVPAGAPYFWLIDHV